MHGSICLVIPFIKNQKQQEDVNKKDRFTIVLEKGMLYTICTPINGN